MVQMKVRSKDIIFSIKATVELLVVTQPVTPLYRKRVDIIGSTGVLEKKTEFLPTTPHLRRATRICISFCTCQIILIPFE